MIRSFLSAYKKNEKGTTAVEFGLISVSFLTLLAGLFETGRFMMAMNTFQYAVENATRYAQVQTGMSESQLEDAMTDMIEEEMTGLAFDGDPELDISFSTTGGVTFVEVDGFYTFTPMITVLPDRWTTLPIRAKSRQPLSS